MPISYPRTDLLDALKVRDGYLTPRWRQESSTTASGVRRVKDLGPMLWLATYTTTAMRHDEIEVIETRLISLRGGIELFVGHDPRRPNPLRATAADDLTGVTVDSISGDRTRLALAGLPSGFELSEGDFLSVFDGASRHLVRVGEGVSSTGGGGTPQFDVLPFVRPSVAAGQAVTLRKASADFQVVPETIQRNYIDALFASITFSAVQVLA